MLSSSSIINNKKRLKQNLDSRKLIACATIIEEILPFIPTGMKYEVLEFGLHINPCSLKIALQNAIDTTSPEVKTILLGYGLCSQAVVGLSSTTRTLVIPKVDDCIAISLGSTPAYQEQHRNEPGTYFLTKGWIESGGTPFNEYDILVKNYGEKKAKHIINTILKHYTRLAFIANGYNDIQPYREYTRDMAQCFNLCFEEIQGSNTLIKKLVGGLWDDEFIIASPGESISFVDFMKNS